LDAFAVQYEGRMAGPTPSGPLTVAPVKEARGYVQVYPSPKLAALYVRVSTALQELDGTSLSTQETACRAKLAEWGIDPTAALLLRETHTGVDLWERPELTRLRAAMQRHEIDLVVCYDLDRLSRDPSHAGVLFSEADFHGVDIIFVEGNLDRTPEGELLRQVRGYAGKVEWLRIRDRVHRGHRGRVEKGLPIVGCRPPYGYRWADAERSRLEVNPATAPVVERIFTSIATGATANKLAQAFTAEGIPVPSGRPIPWNGNTITKLLREPVYLGRREALRSETYDVKVPGVGRRKRHRDRDDPVAMPNVAPALVTSEVAAAAIAQLEKNKLYATRNARDPQRTLLRGGIARCGYCGRSMGLKTSNQVNIYACMSRTRYGCPAHTITVDSLDALVWNKVREIITRPEIVAEELERQRSQDPGTTDLTALDRRLADLQRRQGNLVRRLADVDDDDVAALVSGEIRDFAEHIRRLEDDRAELVAQRRNAVAVCPAATSSWSEVSRAIAWNVRLDPPAARLAAGDAAGEAPGLAAGDASCPSAVVAAPAAATPLMVVPTLSAPRRLIRRVRMSANVSPRPAPEKTLHLSPS
jgi:site-specific DNA recombinase